MVKKRETGCATLLWLAALPLWGGTGRPSDGFLSFILLLGFLVTILGILHMISHIKKWILNLMEDLY